jgi:histidinol-phosphatase (PHP family)
VDIGGLLFRILFEKGDLFLLSGSVLFWEVNKKMKSFKRVSVHGGHSGQFCSHAADSLEDVVQAYISKGFSWLGITEHTPPVTEKFLYPEEREVGFSPELLWKRFGLYIEEGRRLQRKYKDDITLYIAMEIETYSGYRDLVPRLLREFSPDYMVGSVHFVDDIGFDYSQEFYQKAAVAVGGVEALYCRYFDQQYEMLQIFKPAVVGHFDLIRIFDDEYRKRLLRPEIVKRIVRNLSFIKEHELILDFNLRSLLKGGSEPYVSETILKRAHELGISVVPGDDSHGCSSVGTHIDEGVAILQRQGFSTDWRIPRLYC